jgi:hypothetical protein
MWRQPPRVSRQGEARRCLSLNSISSYRRKLTEVMTLSHNACNSTEGA